MKSNMMIYQMKNYIKLLESLNKESAESIHPNNRKRVLRAIELSQNNSSYEETTYNFEVEDNHNFYVSE